MSKFIEIMHLTAKDRDIEKSKMMTKLNFKDVQGQKHCIDLAKVGQVHMYQDDKAYSLYRIDFYNNQDELLSEHQIGLDTMNTVNNKINKYFIGKVKKAINPKKIIKPQKIEMIIFSDLNGVRFKKPLDKLEKLLCETDSNGDKKFSVQFKHGNPLLINQETYDLFEEYIDEGGLDDKNSLQI